MKRTLDMTKGTPLKLLWQFSVPLIFANLGQQLYMIVDASIVGRGVGVKALAAVGSADWTYWLVLWTVTGLTQGFAIFVSRYFGDKNFTAMNKTIAMSAILCIVLGVVLTALGLICARPLLTLLKTPADIIDTSNIYLTTMLSGTLIVTAYNMAASILRAFGDGKSPLIAMIVSAILNVGLDLLFVLVFKWGVFGAAFASVLSQLFSFLYCFVQITKTDCVQMDKQIWKPDFTILKELFVFSAPLALQYIIIAVGGIILQSTINLQGSIFVAGYTAINKLYGLLESTAISLGIAFSTFFAQNFGAGKKDRVLQGVREGVKLCIFSSSAIAVFVLIFGKYLLQLFLDISKPGGTDALEIAWHYLYIMAFCLLVLYLLYVYRNVLQALGNSFWSMISGVAEFFVRVFMGKAVILWLGGDTLFYVEPMAWLGGLIFIAVPYYILRKKYLF